MAIDPAAGCQKRNGYSPGAAAPLLTLNKLLYLIVAYSDRGDTHMLKHTGNYKKSSGPNHPKKITLTLLRGWWGRCEKNYLPKEEGKEGGEKKNGQRARRTRGSNPAPAAC